MASARERERQPLLGTSRSESVDSNASSRRKKWWKRPHPLWLLPAQFLFLLEDRGASVPPSRGNDSDGTVHIAANYGNFTPASDLDSLLPGVTFIEIPKSSDAQKDPRLQQCRHDTEVERRLSNFLTAAMMAQGIVGAATVGFWGSLSDRVGRKPILMVSILALLLADATDLGLGTWPELLGLKFGIFLQVVTGLFGGQLLFLTAVAAYVTDTTEPGSRVGVFSIVDGVQYAGLALGPALGSILIKETDLLLINWYIGVPLRIIYLLLLAFVIPESLSERSRRKERYRYQQAKKEARELREERISDWRSRGKGSLYIRARQLGDAMKAAAQPFDILAPKRMSDDPDDGARDWTMWGLGASFALVMAVGAMTSVKLLYARFVFNWDAAQTGFLLTYISVIRIFTLFIVTPAVIKLLKSTAPLPDRPRPGGSGSLNQLVDNGESDFNKTPEQVVWDEEAEALKVRHDARFDLKVARWSFLFLSAGYLVMSIPVNSEKTYLGGTGIIAFAASAAPALQSLALSFVPQHESGRLLASFNVLSSVALLVIGPPLWNIIYTRSLQFYPQMVFLVGVFWYMGAFVPTLLVRIPKPSFASRSV